MVGGRKIHRTLKVTIPHTTLTPTAADSVVDVASSEPGVDKKNLALYLVVSL